MKAYNLSCNFAGPAGVKVQMVNVLDQLSIKADRVAEDGTLLNFSVHGSPVASFRADAVIGWWLEETPEKRVAGDILDREKDKEIRHKVFAEIDAG